MERTHLGYKLIFTIVKKGQASKVVKAAKLGGADGATIMLGMGTAPAGVYTFWGLDLSPEKEVIMIMTPPDISEVVFANIRRIAKLHKRGSGIHETGSLFSIDIEPEKEIILTLVERDKSEAVLTAIVQHTGLNQPGKGIAFVLEVDKTAGIAHKSV